MSAECAAFTEEKSDIAVGIEEAIDDVLAAVRGQVDRQAFLAERLLDCAEQRPADRRSRRRSC